MQLNVGDRAVIVREMRLKRLTRRWASDTRSPFV